MYIRVCCQRLRGKTLDARNLVSSEVGQRRVSPRHSTRVPKEGTPSIRTNSLFEVKRGRTSYVSVTNCLRGEKLDKCVSTPFQVEQRRAAHWGLSSVSPRRKRQMILSLFHSRLNRRKWSMTYFGLFAWGLRRKTPGGRITTSVLG